MPYGYGASQDYYDRAVQERDNSQQNNQTGQNDQNQGNQNNQNQGNQDGRSAALKTASQESANKYLTGIAEMATDEYGRTRNIYTEGGDPILTFEDGKAVREGGMKRDEFGQYYVPPFEGIGDKGALLSDYERMQLAALKLGHLTSQGDPVSRQAYDEGNALDQLIAGTDDWGNPIYTELGKSVADNWNQLVTGYDSPQGQGSKLQDMITESAGQYTGSLGGPGGGGWGGGYGGGGGGGGLGWMLPSPGYKPEQMAGFYTPQANLQQAMINVHQTPTVFRKRGGIVSLLRLS